MKVLFKAFIFNLNLFDWRFVVYMYRPQNSVKIGQPKSTKKNHGIRVVITFNAIKLVYTALSLLLLT